LSSQIAPADSTLTFASLVALLSDNFPVFRKTVGDYRERMTALGLAAVEDADEVIGLADRVARHQGLSRDDLLENFIEFMVTYLREQNHFLETGKYSSTNKTFDEVRAEIYDDSAYMNAYMYGLLLSYGLFPHHYQEYKTYRDVFLPQLPKGLPVIELGVGHGLFLAMALARDPSAAGVGFDVSDSAIELARCMMAVQRVASDRYILKNADVVKDAYPHESYGGIIAAGLLEHIENPHGFLKELRGRLVPRTGRLFTMVPANTAHPDHLVQFRHVDEIRKMLADSGFATVYEVVLPAVQASASTADDIHPIYHVGVFRAT
jgi:2-polyprenyl-3-methyl-5-hydroxy-6-metoxy-1,4-benzoquinol methylase